MKRIYQSFVCAGLAMAGLTNADLAYGQATATGQGQVALPMPQGSNPFPGSNAAGGPGTTGGSAFPRGNQLPAAMATQPVTVQASGQAGTLSGIPFPRSASTFPTGRQTLPGPSGAPTSNPFTRPGATPQAEVPYASGPASTTAPVGSTQVPPFSGSPWGPGSSELPPVSSGQVGAAGQEAASGQAGIPVPGTKGTPGAGAGAGAAGEGIPGVPSGEMGARPGEEGARPGEEGAVPPLPGPGEGAGAGAGAPTTGEGAAEGAGAPPAEAGAAPPINELEAGAAELNIAGLGGQVGAAGGPAFAPNMIGDLMPFYAHPAATRSPLPVPGPRGAGLPYPSLRSLKISENQSPRPQDRIFWDFNLYSNVNSAVNTAIRSPVKQMNIYSYIWGLEKTFDEGRGSVGLRLPLYTLTANSVNNSVATPTSTALGNLDIFIKYILKQNVETGSLITTGFQITPPTATSRFAGAPYVFGLNTTYFQPFIAYLWQMDRLYIQGFSGFTFPSNNADVTFMFNDVGIGYMVYRNTRPNQMITAVAPTFEVHVNTPFNHRNPYNVYDPAASMYVTNLTYGLNVMFFNRSMLTAALVTPVSSPKPFDAEFALLLNVFYGRTARQPERIIPPVIQ